jgi:hypothetical protein
MMVQVKSANYYLRAKEEALKNEKLTTRCLCVQQMAVLARLALIADELGETDLANTYRSHILYHIKNSRLKLDFT